MALTSTRQRNAVSEGMALGLLMCGRNALPNNKVEVDLAFEGAWRNWAYRSRFSQVNTDLSHGNGSFVMTRARESKKTFDLFWDTDGGELAIYRRNQWVDTDIDPTEMAASIDGDVPAEGWRALAEDFLRRFER